MRICTGGTMSECDHGWWPALYWAAICGGAFALGGCVALMVRAC